MGFFIVGFILWALLAISVVFFFVGLWKKSWKSLLISGLAFLIPSFYFWGAENGFKLIALLPWFVLGLAYYTYKRRKH